MKKEVLKKEKQMKNQMKAKDVQEMLDRIDGEVEETVRELIKLNKELAKEDVPPEERQRLKQRADALMEKMKER